MIFGRDTVKLWEVATGKELRSFRGIRKVSPHCVVRRFRRDAQAMGLDRAVRC
jgi:hypothetical protein